MVALGDDGEIAFDIDTGRAVEAADNLAGFSVEPEGVQRALGRRSIIGAKDEAMPNRDVAGLIRHGAGGCAGRDVQHARARDEEEEQGRQCTHLQFSAVSAIAVFQPPARWMPGTKK